MRGDGDGARRGCCVRPAHAASGSAYPGPLQDRPGWSARATPMGSARQPARTVVEDGLTCTRSPHRRPRQHIVRTQHTARRRDRLRRRRPSRAPRRPVSRSARSLGHIELQPRAPGARASSAASKSSKRSAVRQGSAACVHPPRLILDITPNIDSFSGQHECTCHYPHERPLTSKCQGSRHPIEQRGSRHIPAAERTTVARSHLDPAGSNSAWG